MQKKQQKHKSVLSCNSWEISLLQHCSSYKTLNSVYVQQIKANVRKTVKLCRCWEMLNLLLMVVVVFDKPLVY